MGAAKRGVTVVASSNTPRAKLLVAREVVASIEARVVAVDALTATLTGCATEAAAPDGTRLAQGRVVVAHYTTTRITRPLLAAAGTDLVGAVVFVASDYVAVLQLVNFVYQTSGDIKGVCSVLNTVA